MRPAARLLYFAGCPNTDKARRNLEQALARTGLERRWQETDLENPRTPEAWRGFPSPTILVNGVDVLTGARTMPGASACRFGGPPGADLIAARLGEAKPRRWFAPLTSAPAALLGLFPAAFCPACYPALAGLLSSVGLGALAGHAVLKPLTVILLLLALAGLASQARRARRYPPLALGCLGALGMYAGLYLIPSLAVKLSGIVLLAAASIWSVLPRKTSPSGAPCSACETRGGEADA